MARYRPLKHPSSRITVQCLNCGEFLKTKDDIAWLCKRCGADGRIKDLLNKYSEDKYGKNLPSPKLSKEWKKMTGEKDKE